MLLLLTTSCNRSLKGSMEILLLPMLNHQPQSQPLPISQNLHNSNNSPNNNKSNQIPLNTKTSLWMKSEEPTSIWLRQSCTVRESGWRLGWSLKIRVVSRQKEEWVAISQSRVLIRWKLNWWLTVLARKITKRMCHRRRSRIVKKSLVSRRRLKVVHRLCKGQ